MSPKAVVSLTAAATVVAASAVLISATSGDSGQLILTMSTVFALIVAWVVVRHDPRSPVGPALAWSSSCIAVVMVDEILNGGRPWSTGTWPINLAGLLALLLVFPAGVRSGWIWRLAPVTFLAGSLGIMFCLWGTKEAGGEIAGGDLTGLRLMVGNASMVLIALSMVAGVSSVVLAYRRGSWRERVQVRWLMLAGVLVVALLVAGWAGDARGLPIAVSYTPFIASIVLVVPASVGVAVTRHDLFDVDRLLSRTAAAFVTLSCSAALFALAVWAVGVAVTRNDEVGTTTAAFITALALLPLHQAVTTRVGRVVDHDRYVALAKVESFNADVRAGLREPEAVESVLREAQGDPGLNLLLAGPDDKWHTVDGAVKDLDEPGVAVEAGDTVIARILLSHDSARARRRLVDLARAAWVPIEVSRLRLALHGALVESRASHARMTEAAAAEGRRLERDLHDGAQQSLLATALRLRLLQQSLAGPDAAEVAAAVDELQRTVDELRAISHGVRPSRLDDGLAAALGVMRAATPLPFSLDVGELPVVSESQTLTAYLVVAEAVANVLKHAHASQVRVAVCGKDGRLALTVSDDGIGGVPSSALGGLRDRVSALGGFLTVECSSGNGTTVEAVI